MKLYSYWRSTTSYRVRIALHLKGLAFETVPVDLVAGDQRDPAYADLNPIKGVPTLVTDDGTALTQSLAILDYLDAIAPDPPLLPGDAILRARILGAALVMATDVHPVNNLKVVQKLQAMGHDQDACIAWMHHWMTEGLTAYQSLIDPGTPYAFTDAPGFADICLVAQLYNAHRWGLDLAPFPRLTDIETRCLALDAFQQARPEAQPDAPAP
ncbi:maleylacetoacetate isomerase [Pseudaestuariivita atlantica]|uniref:Maleylacetoacetate isomerase n=1 Tax=Pseudaestuariivita atlantica TaxID=1317121 RepID=A0A0L1JKQ1_9RHOB|nr:maleylacetoacetate isomerase [Pseudaestuariivita atlantica]KNG92339.1 maleylacetoacetate isomerase [Pseudaestuariivita atlantica]